MPRGTPVYCCTYAVHRNSSVWEDPEVVIATYIVVPHHQEFPTLKHDIAQASGGTLIHGPRVGWRLATM